MRLGPTLKSYPVFPDWVFTGEVALSKEQNLSLINEAGTLKGSNVDYGFETKLGSVGKHTINLTKIIGGLFYDEMLAHYRLGEGFRNIECVDPQYRSIKPGQSISHTVVRHRWYQCAVFIDVEEKGSDIFLERFDGKLYSTPPTVQEYTHIINNGINKVVFWPSHIPWGFTNNNSNKNTIVFTSSFIIKR